MRKFWLGILILATLMAFTGAAGADSTVPEEYPPIIEGLDFNGATVYIYDFSSSGTRSEEPTEEQQLQYAYEDWLEATYNVHVVETAGYNWGEGYSSLQQQVEDQDDSVLCIRGMTASEAGKALRSNLFMSWTYGLNGGNFNQGAVDFMTKGGNCYGVTRSAYAEPRQGVYFNKAILGTEATNAIYAAQADGTWTWAMMEAYMEAAQQDTDNDGTPDIWGLTGNSDTITTGLMISNGADYYEFDEDGLLEPGIGSDAAREALAKRKAWSAYLCPSEGWNGYITNWNTGKAAFMIGMTYEGFNSSGFTMDSQDWGFVALPKGPHGTRYVTEVNNNVYGIPNVYDAETALKLEQIFTLWTRPVPGISDDSWASSLATITSDENAIATYGMLREPEHGKVLNHTLMGDANSTISDLLWNIDKYDTVDALINSAMHTFQARCDAYNGNGAGQTEADADITINTDRIYYMTEESAGYVITPVIPQALQDVPVEYWGMNVWDADNGWTLIYTIDKDEEEVYPGSFTIPKNLLQKDRRYSFMLTIKLTGSDPNNLGGEFIVLDPAGAGPGISITLKDRAGNIVTAPMMNEYYQVEIEGGENVNALRIYDRWHWQTLTGTRTYQSYSFRTEEDSIVFAAYGSTDGGETWNTCNAREYRMGCLGEKEATTVTLDRENPTYTRGETITATADRVDGCTEYQLTLMIEVQERYDNIYNETITTDGNGQEPVVFTIPTDHLAAGTYLAEVRNFAPGYKSACSEWIEVTITATGDPRAAVHIYPEAPVAGGEFKAYAFVPGASRIRMTIKRNGNEAWFENGQDINEWNKYYQMKFSQAMSGAYEVFVYADGAEEPAATTTFTVTSLGTIEAVTFDEGSFPEEIEIGDDLQFSFNKANNAAYYSIHLSYNGANNPEELTDLTVPQPTDSSTVSVTIPGKWFDRAGSYDIGIVGHATGYDSRWNSITFQVRDNSPWHYQIEEGKTLILSGEGEIPDFESTDDTPWAQTGINRVIIEDGITGLGKNVLSGFSGTVRVDFMQKTRPVLDADVLGGGTAVFRFFGDYSSEELAAWTAAGVNGATWTRLPFQPTNTVWLNFVKEYTDNGTRTKWMISGPGCPYAEGLEVTPAEAKELTFDRRWVYLNALPTGEDLGVFSAMDIPTEIWFSGNLYDEESRAFTLTTGTPGMLQSIDVMMDGLQLTVQLQEGETLPEMTVRNGTRVTVNGNIGKLELTNSHEDDPAAVTVNGNIGELAYYSAEAGNELFRGSLSLKGTIAHVTVYGQNGFYVPGVCTDENDRLLFDNLPCTTYENIVRNGAEPAAVVTFDPEAGEHGTSSLALTETETAAGTPVGELSLDQFTFDYTFREDNVVSFNVRPKEDSGLTCEGAYIWNIREKNPSFTANDMIRGEDVTVYITWTGTGENDPVITLNPDAEGNGFDNVYLEDCKAVINCPVTGSMGVWQNILSKEAVYVTINNSVGQLVLVMQRQGGKVELGTNGMVQGGYCTRGIRGLRNFRAIHGACTLAEDGQLSILTAKNGQQTKSVPATDSVVTEAAGQQLEAGEIASMDINDSSEQSLEPDESEALAGFIAAAETDPDNPLPNLTVESVIDISVQTYTHSEGAKELTPGVTLSTLDEEVPIRIGNDTGKEMIVVRLHEENGTMTATPLLTSAEEVLNFESDLFSKYALVSIGWETEDNWNDWTFAQVTNEYVKGEWTLYITGSGAIPSYDNARKAPWSSAVMDKENVRIIIGNGITGIGKNAFGSMRGTVRVDFEGTEMPTVDPDAFAGTNAIGHYYSTNSSWANGISAWAGTGVEWIYLPKYEQEYPGVAGLDYVLLEGETDPCWVWNGNKLTLRQAEEMSYTHLTVWMNDAIPSGDDATLFTARNIPWRLYAETYEEGTMTLDAGHGGTTLELLQMSSPMLTLNVDHSQASSPMIWVNASDGILKFTGNTDELTLRSSGGSDGAVTFRGNIGELAFYNETTNTEGPDGSISPYAYNGDLKVIGTIGSGSEYGEGSIDIPGIGNGIELPGGGKVRSFTDLTLTEADGWLIKDGVFQRTDIPAVSTSIGDYRLTYMFRDQEDYDDDDGIFLVLEPKNGGQRITIDILANKPDFTTNNIIWGTDTDISVHYWDATPNMPQDIVLNGGTDSEGNAVGINQLFTNSTYGTITLNCPARSLEVAQGAERGDSVGITINNTVSWYAHLSMRGNGSTIQLGENGEVHGIMLAQYLKDTRYVDVAYGAGTLYADGRLCVMSNKDGESLQSILPGDSQLAGANGGKTTIMDISEKDELDDNETEAVEDALNAAEEVATVFDVSVTEYTESGDATECHELSSAVQMAVQNTTGGEAYVARLHEDDEGELTVTPVSEATSDDQIWFTSDRFSTYVVISTGAGIDPTTLNTLWLPAGLTRIEDEAFAGGDFEAVVVPDNCIYIGHGAFANCPNLIYISYGSGTVVEEDAFSSELVPVIRE